MRISLIQMALAIMFCTIANAGKTNAQEILQKRITLSAENQKVEKILNTIGKIVSVKFMYSPQLIKSERRISLKADNEKLSTVLEKFLAPLSIIYEVSGNHIILKGKPTSNIEVVPENRSSFDHTITGKVTDEKGEGLPGVNVILKGTNIGTASDANGNYKLIINDETTATNGILIFSYIGFIAREVPINSLSTINIELTSDIRSLSEVVVVGYGTQKKVNLTGAVASVKGEDIIKRPVTNPATMLQGRMPGVQIVQNSGEPGNEGVSIRVRGNGSFSGDASDPLVLIDGVPGNLSNLNPNNIESISVLKDAASASIYGARAANGVILVTTKVGQEGKISMQYSGNYAIHSPTKLFDLITNSAEYMEMYNEARINSGLTTGLYTDEIINTYRNASDHNLYPNTDWLDLVFDPAPTQMHNLSFNGGNKGTTFDVSIGYINQKGIMKGFDYDRFNIRLNLASKVNDNIRFGGNLAMKRGDKNAPRQGSQDLFLSTMSQAPTYSPQLADGTGRYTNKAYDFEYNNKNPIAIVDNKVSANTIDYAIQTQGWIDIKLLKGLTWNTKVAVNLDFSKYNDFRPQVPLFNFRTNAPMGTLDVGGTGLVVQDDQNVYKNIYSFLNYEKKLGRHELNAKVGYSAEDNTYQRLWAYRKEYPNDDFRQLDAGGAAVQQNNGTQNEWALMSFFGRLGYNFDSRYLLEANLRYDGSSKLAPSLRWQAFPSVSVGWRLSEEKFFKDLNLTWLNQFKIRGSYGKLGNQNTLSLYPYQAFLRLTDPYSFDNSNLISGIAKKDLNNLNIIWETTTSSDIGVDLTLFKGLDLTLDWYKKRTTDAIRSSQLTEIVGLGAPYVNRGTMENTGVELGIQYRNQISSGLLSGLTYSAGVNMDHYRNKLVQFGARQINSNTIYEEGHEYDGYYMLEQTGIFQSQEEISNSPKQFEDATVPGDLKFKDANGDGKVDNDDRIHISGRYPALNYAFNFSVDWKGFDLTAQLQGVENVKYFVRDWGTVPFVQGAPPTTNWRDRWTETNPSTTMPRMYWGNSAPQSILRNSSWYLQNGSYLRLKNITFGYTIPATLTQRLNISQVRVYFSGDNILTKTKYPGLDPERASSGSFVNYPQNKIYSFGINVKF